LEDQTVGRKHKVRFEPVDIEIEVDEEETVLDAAFRQGVSFFHGCREGQCSACKQFLLEGDLEMDRYSTFALNEYEAEEGYVLLCRAHAYSDLHIELIYYDEDMMRMGIPIQEVQAEVEEIESLTPEIKRLVLKLVDPPEMAFRAGQYAELYVPGSDEHRAYSMANTPHSDKRAEFIIRVFPDGAFSGLLKGGLKAGDGLKMEVPYGVFMLREDSESDVIFIGGGTGMAPLLSILRYMAQKGTERNATFYFGARTRKDLFYLDKIRELGERLPRKFRFVPALSEPGPDDEWDGETGLITDVVARLEEDLTGTEAYLAGPPPMIDAALPVLEGKGVEKDKIHYDKFTESGAVEGGEKEQRGPEQAEEASR
jgi:propane monooxygenase reductase component